LVQCEYFRLYRYRGSRPFVHDGGGAGSVLVGLEGEMMVRGGGREESLRPGESCSCRRRSPRRVRADRPYVMLECVPL